MEKCPDLAVSCDAVSFSRDERVPRRLWFVVLSGRRLSASCTSYCAVAGVGGSQTSPSASSGSLSTRTSRSNVNFYFLAFTCVSSLLYLT